MVPAGQAWSVTRRADGDRRATGRGAGATAGRGRLLSRVRAGRYRPLAGDDARVAYWVRHVRNGVILSEVAAVVALAYTLITDSPGRQHPVLIGLATLFIVTVPRLLLPTLGYMSAAYSPHGVVAMGSSMTLGYLLFVELPGLTVSGLSFVAVLAAFTMICAMASANSWGAYDRQVELIRQHQTMASTDALTGIPNRRVLLARLSAAVETVQPGRRTAVCLVDLDGYKKVTDTAGHAAGDAVLKTVSTALCGVVQETDTVARLGGDEFAVLADVPVGGPVESMAARLCEVVAVVGRPSGVPVRVGVAEVAPGDGVEELTYRVDVARYRAKSAGGRPGHRAGRLTSDPRFDQPCGEGQPGGMAQSGSAVGTVLRWDAERGGAILDAQECPGGCWAAAAVVEHGTHGSGELRAGQVVRFDWVAEAEGPWAFRATRVEPREDLQATPGA